MTKIFEKFLNEIIIEFHSHEVNHPIDILHVKKLKKEGYSAQHIACIIINEQKEHKHTSYMIEDRENYTRTSLTHDNRHPIRISL